MTSIHFIILALLALIAFQIILIYRMGDRLNYLRKTYDIKCNEYDHLRKQYKFVVGKGMSCNSDIQVFEIFHNRIDELETRLFKMGAMRDSPCFICGYTGPGYYRPEIHTCAKKHHELYKKTEKC